MDILSVPVAQQLFVRHRIIADDDRLIIIPADQDGVFIAVHAAYGIVFNRPRLPVRVLCGPGRRVHVDRVLGRIFARIEGIGDLVFPLHLFNAVLRLENTVAEYGIVFNWIPLPALHGAFVVILKVIVDHGAVGRLVVYSGHIAAEQNRGAHTAPLLADKIEVVLRYIAQAVTDEAVILNDPGRIGRNAGIPVKLDPAPAVQVKEVIRELVIPQRGKGIRLHAGIAPVLREIAAHYPQTVDAVQADAHAGIVVRSARSVVHGRRAFRIVRGDKPAAFKGDVFTDLIHAPVVGFDPFRWAGVNGGQHHAVDIFVLDAVVLKLIPDTVFEDDVAAVFQRDTDAVIEAEIPDDEVLAFRQRNLEQLIDLIAAFNDRVAAIQRRRERQCVVRNPVGPGPVHLRREKAQRAVDELLVREGVIRDLRSF